MKSYAAMSAAYLTANGLNKIFVRDAATGVRIMKLVTEKQLKHLQRIGRPYTYS